MQRIIKLLFILVSTAMIALCLTGVYGLCIASQRAATAQAEVERLLKEKQEQIDREMAAALAEQERLKALREAEISNFKEEAAKWNGYADASEIILTGIGDSVVVACKDALQETFPHGYFDARYGRKIQQGIQVLTNLKEHNQLGDVIFLSLTTNYSFDVTENQIHTLIQLCENRPVFFTTTYGLYNQSANKIVTSVVSQYDNAYIVDWQSYAKEHPEWILSDGLHPNDEGSKEYAKLLHDEIQTALFPTPEEIEQEVKDHYGNDEAN